TFTANSSEPVTNDALIAVKRGGNLTLQGTGSIETTTVYTALKMTIYGEAATGDLASLTVNGVTIKGKNTGICGNGNRHNTQIVINSGTIENTRNGTGAGTSEESCAIYHPQDGTLIINGGTIKGYDSGVEMRSGNLYVNGGTIESTASPTDVKANGNGATTVGAAVAIAQHTTGKNITANITGGIFSGHTALSITNPNSQSAGTLAVNVTGGTFTSTNTDNGNAVYSSDSRVTTQIGGGTFTGKVETTEGVSVSIANGVTLEAANDQTTVNKLETIPTVTIPATGSIVINETNKVITLHRGSLSTTEITAPEGYTFALGDDVPKLDATSKVPPKVRDESFAVSGEGNAEKPYTATYTGTAYGEYFTLQDDSKAVKHFNATGGGVINISGLNGITPESGKSIGDYVNLTNINIVQAAGAVDANGQYAAGNYTVTVGKDLLEQLGDGKKLTFGTSNSAKFSLAFNTGETESTYSENSDKLYVPTSGTDSGTAATASITSGTLTYTAKIDNYAYYTLTSGAGTASTSNKEIAFHAQVGGQEFELSGLNVSLGNATVDANGVITATMTVTAAKKAELIAAGVAESCFTAVSGETDKFTFNGAIAKVGTVTDKVANVYLTAAAFGTGAITVEDVAGDDVTYQLAYDSTTNDTFL
ncbi:MAG: hypothetical protein IKD80_05735, partial [Selenomonadaceae bacterium]|nr:hypothetical protein [Selenomonadaceae bacterium]